MRMQTMWGVKHKRAVLLCLASWLAIGIFSAHAEHAEPAAAAAGEAAGVKKPSPDAVIALLKEGNTRFVTAQATHPHADLSRLRLAGSSNQGDYCLATVLTCSDSRVPVESIFDAGVMDIFVVRVAGNVCGPHELGSMEYGVAHVKTPVLIIMGHTQCGAVTAATQKTQGHGHALERNIPSLIKEIEPAVKRAMEVSPKLEAAELIQRGIEENVWQGIETLFTQSPKVRELVSAEKLKVLGAIYDVGTGRVQWLSENKTYRILGRVESDPLRMTEAMADESAWQSGHKPQPRAHAEAIPETHEPAPAHAPAPTHATTEASPPPADHGVPAAHGAPEHAAAENVALNAAHSEPAVLAHGAPPTTTHAAPTHAAPAHGASSETGHDALASAGHPAPAHGGTGEHGGTGTSEESKVPTKLLYVAGGVCLLGVLIMVMGVFMRSRSTKVAHAHTILDSAVATTQMISPPTSIDVAPVDTPAHGSH